VPDSWPYDKDVQTSGDAQGTSYLTKQEEDTALASVPIPSDLLSGLPQYRVELPRYVQGAIRAGKQRGDLEKIWSRIMSNDEKQRLVDGDFRAWREVHEILSGVHPLEGLFGPGPPAPLKERIETFDTELEGLKNCVQAALFSGGGQDDLDKVYNSLKAVTLPVDAIFLRCEQRAFEILRDLEICTAEMQKAVERARKALAAASGEQPQANLEKQRSERPEHAQTPVKEGSAYATGGSGAAPKRGHDEGW
jgi:hypothetical protein